MPSAIRRHLLRATPLFLLPALAHAQGGVEAWPSGPIRLVMPFPAGAVSDSAARALANVLAPRLGQPVIVENRPGAGGGLGAQAVLGARPDGHTVLLVNNSVLTMVPRVSQLRYDPVRDFAPVAFLGDSFNILAINRDLPARNLAEFAALARSRPGDLVHASPGVGSYGHVAGELLQRRLGIELLHAPFAGIVPAINAVLAGQGHAVMGPNAMSFAQSGQVRGVAVIAEERWPAVPEVPLLSGSGVAEWPLDFWYAVVAPRRHAPPGAGAAARGLRGSGRDALGVGAARPRRDADRVAPAGRRGRADRARLARGGGDARRDRLRARLRGQSNPRPIPPSTATDCPTT